MIDRNFCIGLLIGVILVGAVSIFIVVSEEQTIWIFGDSICKERGFEKMNSYDDFDKVLVCQNDNDSITYGDIKVRSE